MTTTEPRLRDLDFGRCLITFEKMPTASQQTAHIVSPKTSMTQVKSIEVMWQTSLLNLNSTKNQVTLRADWCLSYHHGDWAFVPAEHILRKILKYKANTFGKPYPRFDPDELQDYVFVPLPTLRRRYILRQMTGFDEDQDDWDEDEDEDEDEEGERERGESGGHEAEAGDEQEEEEEGEDAQDMVDIEDGNATVHIKPFSGFPPLGHHAHPFFVIRNALPKLRKHMLSLRPEHLTLLMLMNDIEIIWLSRCFKASSKLGKRRKPDDDDAPSDRPKRKTRGAAKRGNPKLVGATKVRETRGSADVGKGKRKARGANGNGKTMLAQPQQFRYPTPSPTGDALRTKAFVFDDSLEVSAWAAAVAAAGPPEVMSDEADIWSDEEPVRSPIQRWDRWHVPYKQPKQRARFCSSDWPMYLYSFPLWM